jgi:hypothetical protein
MVALALIALLASCSPDYAHSAFLCKDPDGCPSGQTCLMGRCRRGIATAPDGVMCDHATCDQTQQCCLYTTGSPTCIAVGDVCPDTSALCDGVEDCQAGDRCCADGSTVACDASCKDYACQRGDDCPTTEPNCCHFDTRPWGTCSSQPC